MILWVCACKSCVCVCVYAICYTSSRSTAYIRARMFTCVSKSSGNWRRWGQQWEDVSGKWHSIRHECRFDQVPLLNEAGNTFLHILFLTINISLSLSPSSTIPSPLSSPSSPPPFPHPPIIPLCPSFFYGWVVIFPWDSGGGELSRTRCFIIPNKAGDKFRPPHLGFSDETLRQKPIFFFFFVRHIPSFSIVLFHTCSLSLSWHHFLISSFIYLFMSLFCPWAICSCRNLQYKIFKKNGCQNHLSISNNWFFFSST